MHICARMLRKSVKSVSVFIYAYWIFWNNFYNEFKKASALKGPVSLFTQSELEIFTANATQ